MALLSQAKKLTKTLRYSPAMLDISIVNETSPEANWNGQPDGWKSHVLSQADALTKNGVCRQDMKKHSLAGKLNFSG